MAKRNWPDHVGVGLTVTYEGVEVKIVDVKAGPMFFNSDELSGTDVKIRGTLKLRVKYPGGQEVWTPPMDGQVFCEWADKQKVSE